MASINKVILIGNLGKDPEIRYTPNGAAICSIRLATTRSWKDKTSNEKVEETEWHSVVFFDRLAEIAGEYLKKGRSVYVEGRLKTRKWQDKEGHDRYTTEIIGDDMKMLGSREGLGGSAEEGGRSSGYGERGASGGAAERPARPAPAGKPAPQKSATGFDDMDDDIPF
jgi:single-strand DNA-binding protein